MPTIETNFLYHHCTWEEIKEYFFSNDTVLIPTGSCEQHGYHLPLCTDSIVPEAMAFRAAQRTNVMTLPVLHYGHSSNHTSFPGTISIEPATYTLFMRDIVHSLLCNGAKKIIFINGHSGNTPSLQQACHYLREKKAFGCIVDWFSVVGQIDQQYALSGHADFIETAAVLSLAPDLVKLEKAQPYVQNKLSESLSFISWNKLLFNKILLDTWTRTSDASLSGNFGSLKNSTPAVGHRLLEMMDDFLADLVREIINIDLSVLPQSPMESAVQFIPTHHK